MGNTSVRYILVRFDSGLDAYQEVDPYGDVLRYLDSDGYELFAQPPIAVGCVVTDPDPPKLPWMQ